LGRNIHKASGRQILADQVGRHERDAQPGEQCLPQGVTVVGLKPTIHPYGLGSARSVELPAVARAEEDVHEAFVPGQVGHPSRLGVAFQVLRRRTDHMAARRQIGRDETGGLVARDADRQVVAFLDQIDVLIAEGQFDLDVRIAFEEFRQLRSEAAIAEADRRRDAQAPARCPAGLQDLRFRGRHFGHYVLAVAVEPGADLGQAERPGRPVEQPRAQVPLERGDMLAHRRLRHAEHARGGREAAGVDHAHEDGDVRQTVHVMSPASSPARPPCYASTLPTGLSAPPPRSGGSETRAHPSDNAWV
jgi:hypothetical protein